MVTQPAAAAVAARGAVTAATHSSRRIALRQHSPTHRSSLTLVILVLLAWTNAGAQTAQDHVHGRSHTVMPFDISKAVHIFTMTESGGVERVIVRDKRDAGQVPLIQQHLRKEAE